MSKHTKYSRIVGSDGKTQYFLVPVEEFQQLLEQTNTDQQVTIPNTVVKMHLLEEMTIIAAWRKHLSLTQEEVAHRMNISQAAYSQIENAKHPRKSTQKKVAKAFDIDERQLSV
ncbi:MAG: helix-turn-helix transcriptional regulator [Bacilli bacterium]|jgi:DNA-binding XRE family transcriptional regulator|nr:helix-turn-helix transcriptional regulator [Sphaerochaetaceae bacterium]